ncbi:hypothetical protein PIB30_051021 [Stylosanthes scabra]|uniref:Uncharacterized protein n=1 Tax=Stylosanthes scabra TaxID=79078 RepID=A0ABU6WG11_9FABA|nr:hypothetical protein [Stylosanthes scabra]
MGSGIIYYEIKKREKYEDSDEILRLQRQGYTISMMSPLSIHFTVSGSILIVLTNFKYRVFCLLSVEVHLRRKIRFHRDQMVPPTQDQLVREVGRPIKSWELIPPSDGWMWEGDDVQDKRLEKEEEVEKNGDAFGVGEERDKKKKKKKKK